MPTLRSIDHARSRRRRRPLLLVLAAALVVGLVPTTAGAGSGPILIDESFEQSSWYDDWGFEPDNRNDISLVNDGFAGKALRVDYTSGSHFGTDFRWRFPEHGDSAPTEAYYRYYIRFDDPLPNGTAKLPGLAGIYHNTAYGTRPSTVSKPGWSARMSLRQQSSDGLRIAFYTYHLDQPTSSGEWGLWAKEIATMPTGDWVCIEGAVKLNTPGSSNGWIRGWVNEEPAYFEQNMRFRRSGESHIKIREFWFNNYWGGEDPYPGGPNASISFDELVVSTQRVGCLTETDPVLRCDGEYVTIYGTPLDDYIVGTSGDDVIHALGGYDTVIAGGGDDIVCGGSDDDLIKGKGGNDRIFGNGGHDQLKGNGGDDYVSGDDGKDRVVGGGGNDTLLGGGSFDKLKGGGGNDTLVGGADWDKLWGGSGVDDCDGEREYDCE